MLESSGDPVVYKIDEQCREIALEGQLIDSVDLKN